MTLRERRTTFTANLAKLIQWCNNNGFECALDEVKRTQLQADAYAREGKGIRNSQHLNACAADLVLYKAGVYLMFTRDYSPAGDYWESIHPHNRWGGRYDDGNHFEMLETPR